jgi:DNA polymerase-3 subunit epsilon
MLEMLSQARGISFEVAPNALEAALLEPDEIKRFRPPYNVALTETRRNGERGSGIGAPGERQLWFTTPDLIERGPRPSRRCPVGPFPSAVALDEFAALVRESREALGHGRWAPDATTFEEGYARFRDAHAELSLDQLPMSARLLRLGTRLWRQGRRDRDADAEEAGANDRRSVQWTSENVQLSLEWLVIRTALARRRAGWLTRLADASIAWCERGGREFRLLVIENGEITVRASVHGDVVPPVPPGCERSVTARHEAFTVARFDRLRVLTTELKRLASAGAPVAVRLGAPAALAGARLASLLAWL